MSEQSMSSRVAVPLHAPIRGLALAAALAVPGIASAQLQLDGFWVRAMPPTQTMTAGYGSITNRGVSTVVVTGVRAAETEEAQLHTTVQRGSGVSMKRLENPTLGPGESLTLEPGGAHIMLMGMSRMPPRGSTIEVCIETQSSGSTCTQAQVTTGPSGGASSGSRDGHHAHHP